MTNFGKIALLLLLCATTMGGFLWLPPALGFQTPALARIVVFHVPCTIVATLASVVAAWYALAYLRTRHFADDVKSRVSFVLGLVFWVLTVVTGAIFAQAQWGQYWNWDPKERCILLLLLINVAYFALRAAIDDPRKAASLSAAYALFAAAAVPFLTYYLPNSTPDTLHPKNVITSRDGLGPEYKIILWSGTFGLCMVYLWAFRLHVAIEVLQERWNRHTQKRTAPAPSHVIVVKQGLPR